MWCWRTLNSFCNSPNREKGVVFTLPQNPWWSLIHSSAPRFSQLHDFLFLFTWREGLDGSVCSSPREAWKYNQSRTPHPGPTSGASGWTCTYGKKYSPCVIHRNKRKGCLWREGKSITTEWQSCHLMRKHTLVAISPFSFFCMSELMQKNLNLRINEFLWCPLLWEQLE